MADSFPHAPGDWNVSVAEAVAREDGLELTDDHWQLIRALQEYYNKAERPHLRQIKDALEESFHSRGGMKYLYEIIPGGPVAQGCRLAGLDVPAGAVDKSFGSVA
jgi:tRNA 2-thiouridine synthesizing protein E